MSTLKIISPGIPALCNSIGWNGTYGDFYPLKNSYNGRRHCMAKLDSAVAQQWMQFDLGSTVSQAVDHLYFAQPPYPERLTLTGCAASIRAPLEVATQPTAFWDFSDDSQVTQDALNRISAVGNKGSVAAATLAQATDAAKFVRTRSDNRENRYLYSHALDNAWWTKNNLGVTTGQLAPDGSSTATLFTEASDVNKNHNFVAPINTINVAPGTYISSIYAKYAGRQYFTLYPQTASTAYVIVDIQNGTIVKTAGTGYVGSSIVESPAGSGWYKVSITHLVAATAYHNVGVYFTKSATVSSQAYDGDGTSGTLFWDAQLQSNLADAVSCPTTDHPLFRGVNGRSVARAMGEQYMGTAATMADLFAAGAKTVISIVRPSAIATGTAQILMRSSSGHWALYLDSTARAEHFNNDGSNDYALSAAITAQLMIISATHEGGNITINVNGTEGTPGASGDTGALTGTIRVGASQTPDRYLTGDLCAILTWNVALSEADRAAVYAWAYAKFGGGYAYQNLDFGKELFYASCDWNTDASSPYTGDMIMRIYGGYPQDVVIPITQTAAYRYWWLEREIAYADAHGKIFFGLQVDPGVDCQTYAYSQDPGKNAAFETGAGGTIMAAMRAVKDSVYLTWQNVTAANLAPLLDALTGYGRDATYCLYATNTDILAGKTLAHVRLVPGSLSHAWQDTTEAGVTRFRVEARFEVLTDYTDNPDTIYWA